MKNSFKKKVSQLVNRLANNIHYVGKESFALAFMDNEFRFESSEKTQSSLVKVLSRSLYFETTKHYQILDKKDLQKAISLEVLEVSPFPESVHFYRVEKQAEGSKVNFWFIDRKLLKKLNIVADFVVPETLLLWDLFREDQITEVVSPAGPIFVCKSNDSVLSHWDKNYLGKSLADASVKHFMDEKRFVSAILKGLLQTLRGQVGGFKEQLLIYLERKLNNFHYRTLFLPVIVLLGGILFQSIYLMFMEYRLGTQKETLSPLINENIEVRRKYENSINRISAHDSFIQEQTNYTAVQNKIADELNSIENLRIINITYSANLVEIKGRVPNAVQMLTKLSGASTINKAEFLSPVRATNRFGESAEEFHLQLEVNSNG